MSSISSVSSSYGVASGSTERSRKRGPHGIEQDLQQFLTDQGVDSTQQQQILGEVQKSLKASVAEGNRPSQSTLKDTIASVLQQHGVDGSSFVNGIPDAQPPGGPRGIGGPGGPRGAGGPQSKRDSDSDDSSSSDLFLQFLLKQLEQLQNDTSSKSQSNNSVNGTQASQGIDPTSGTASTSAVASTSSTTSNLSSLQEKLSKLLNNSNSPYSGWASLVGSLSTFDVQA